MMERASAFSHWLEPENWDSMHTQLQDSDAHKEPDQDGNILNWTKA